MRICPNDKFIEIFAQRFHYFEGLFYKFFALNLLFQDTSCSLALKYSSFLFNFFSFAFYNINFRFKISKICPKISHFSQISHSRGNTGHVFVLVILIKSVCIFLHCRPVTEPLHQNDISSTTSEFTMEQTVLYLQEFQKSNLHYTRSRYYAEACKKWRGHLRGFAPGQRSSEKTSQR